MASLPVEALMTDKKLDEAESTPDPPDDHEFDKRDKLAVGVFSKLGVPRY
jgi:hypothetical protein